MNKKNSNNILSTNDKVIRVALRILLEKELGQYRKTGHKAEIFEELGVQHGTNRIDFAIVNGIMCGYEIKSDRDTLDRLPEQVKEFSAVFDKLTLVVGKRHLYCAIHLVPEWWGIELAKIETKTDRVVFQTIREAEKNKEQRGLSMARLLWREEALHILEEQKMANGLRHKPREFIYEKLADMLDTDALRKLVNSSLISREGWRLDEQLQLGGD